MFLFSWFGTVVLRFLGWKNIPDETIALLHEHKRCVLVYPHTSNWDFVILFCYMMKYSNFPRRSELVTLVKPQFFDKFPILSKIGCIPSAKLEDRASGILNRINEHLRYKNFMFLISPKGKRDISDWRKGYYYISKEFKCPIIPIGLNYTDHCVQNGNVYFPNENDDELQVKSYLQLQLAGITPFHPERSEFPLIKFNHRKIGIIPNDRLIIYACMLFIGNMYSNWFCIFGIISLGFYLRRFINV